MKRANLYRTVLLVCMVGYAWVLWHFVSTNGFEGSTIGFCIFKHVTGWPCHSCGATRSVVSLLLGDIKEALYWNPLGIVILAIMVIGPVWIFLDLVTGKAGFQLFYLKTEQFLRKKTVALILIGLLLINWIWNFFKGL